MSKNVRKTRVSVHTVSAAIVQERTDAIAVTSAVLMRDTSPSIWETSVLGSSCVPSRPNRSVEF